MSRRPASFRVPFHLDGAEEVSLTIHPRWVEVRPLGRRHTYAVGIDEVVSFVAYRAARKKAAENRKRA